MPIRKIQPAPNVSAGSVDGGSSNSGSITPPDSLKSGGTGLNRNEIYKNNGQEAMKKSVSAYGFHDNTVTNHSQNHDNQSEAGKGISIFGGPRHIRGSTSSSNIKNGTSQPTMANFSSGGGTEGSGGGGGGGSESAIVRELREQRQRDEELRHVYRNRGIDLPSRSDAKETPFNVDDLHIASQEKEIRTLRRQSRADDLNTPLGTSKSDDNHKYVEEIKSELPAEDKTLNIVANQESSMKTRDNEMDAENSKFVDRYFSRAGETPIEREIRLAAEREAELRRIKGLPADDRQAATSIYSNGNQYDDENGSHQGSINYSSNGNNSSGRINDSVPETATTSTMKRLASNRLQLEIEKEKERELGVAILRGGVVVSQQQQSQGTRSPSLNHLSARSPGQQQGLVENGRGDGGVAKSGSGSSSPGSFLVVSASSQNSRSSEPDVLRRYSNTISQQHGSKDTNEELTHSHRKTGTAADSLIEKELKEMRRREEELKRARNPTADHNSSHKAYIR